MNIDSMTVFLLALGITVLITFGLFLNLYNVWLRAWVSGAYISFSDILAIRLRKSPLEKIVGSFIRIRKHGIEMSIMELENEYIKDPKNFDTYVAILIEEHQRTRKEEIG